MRGLADTLDYTGHGYKEKGRVVDKYIALGKWMESREIWKWQGNDDKANKIEDEIKELRKTINDERWKAEHQEQAQDAEQGDKK